MSTGQSGKHATYENAKEELEQRARVPQNPIAAAGTAAGESLTGGRLLDRLSSAERKEYPMASGLLDYFPDACAEVSHVSYLGNQKHNPGQPLHWSRSKSSDHADCVVRHYTTRHGMDGAIMHLAEAAWRAMADLQIALEEKYKLDPPKGAR
jgi:hypothetical protein